MSRNTVIVLIYNRHKLLDLISSGYSTHMSVTVDERSKACTVLARSEPGIVGSNPNQGMDV
jgi:hypothetical protein